MALSILPKKPAKPATCTKKQAKKPARPAK